VLSGVLFGRMAPEHIFISCMVYVTVPSVGSVTRSDERRINCRKSTVAECQVLFLRLFG